MKPKPKCVIVTGRPGAGKTTLAKKLSQQLSLPLVSRDEIKEGYVNTFGISHDQLPAETNGVATNFFFQIVAQYLANQISIVIEAAFQHHVWETQISQLETLSQPFFLICSIDENLAAARHLQRGLANEKREFYHGDQNVSLYKTSGIVAPPTDYQAPNFALPTLQVSTEDSYAPDIDEIVGWIRS